MRLGRAIMAGIVATFAAVGCQAIVSSDVPDFRCVSADPSACPPGFSCDLTTQTCVAGLVEAGEVPDDDGGDGADDGAASLAALGESCRVDSECQSGLCGTSTILTTTIVPAGQLPICTRTCCTSGDCPSGFVCFGAATGGNYCVPKDRAGATPPPTGGSPPGASCTQDNQCRSGRCEIMGSLGMRCLDTCCLGGNCTSGTVCRITSFATPAPARIAWGCGQPVGDAGPGATCTSTSDCRNDNCIGAGLDRRCRPSCCNTASCASEGFTGGVCAYTFFGADHWKSCLTAATAGTKVVGQSCMTDSECATRYCDGELKRCANVCCRDADCPGNERCAPSAVGIPFLRCVQ